MLNSLNESFVLVSNTAKESNIFTLILVWVLVLAPLLGFICWRVMISFGPTPASIIGAILGIAILFTSILFSLHKEFFTLIFTPQTVQVIDKKGKVIESLGIDGLKMETASHTYIGRTSVRVLVLILKNKDHEISIGKEEPSLEPPATFKNVPAPNFLIKEAELNRLMEVVASIK